MLSNYILKTEDCKECDNKEKDENKDENKDEMSVTGGGEAFSEPIGKDKEKEYIRREKLNNIKETIQKILNNK